MGKIFCKKCMDVCACIKLWIRVTRSIHDICYVCIHTRVLPHAQTCALAVRDMEAQCVRTNMCDLFCVCVVCLRVTWHIVALGYFLLWPCSVCMLVCMHALFCSNMGIVYVYTYAYMCILTCANAHVHTHINTDTQTQTHKHTHASTHTRTYTHTLALALSLSLTHTHDVRFGSWSAVAGRVQMASTVLCAYAFLADTQTERHKHTYTHIYK